MRRPLEEIVLCLEDAATMAMIQEAVLGLLSREPSHGYALWQRLQSWSADPESIQTSSVYMALRRLAEADAIEVVATAPAPRPGERPRHTFAITGVGQRRLDEWLAQPPTSVEHLRLRIALAQPIDDLVTLIDWVVNALGETQRRLGVAPSRGGDEERSWGSACEMALSTLTFHELSARAQWLAEAHAQLRKLHALAAAQPRP
jgi:DNA-binding PadR family transcriptional regulator